MSSAIRRPLQDPPTARRPGAIVAGIALAVVCALAGCGYNYYAGPLQPVDEQAPSMTIADDGSVTYVQGRLEVRLRPLTDEELNRMFSAQSVGGHDATNPYTFGDTEFYEAPHQRQRFTVFRLSIKNYEYPKVKADPARMELAASNGRTYWSLGVQQLDNYYRIYARGYQGNEYIRYRERRDLLMRSMFATQEIFSGQEAEGLVVFPCLHPDVERVQLLLHDLVLRFDYRNEPIERVDLAYDFQRDVGRLYPDGTVELTASN